MIIEGVWERKSKINVHNTRSPPFRRSIGGNTSAIDQRSIRNQAKLHQIGENIDIQWVSVSNWFPKLHSGTRRDGFGKIYDLDLLFHKVSTMRDGCFSTADERHRASGD